MVWRISKESSEKEITDLQKTGLYGTCIILTLALLAWALEHIRIV